MTWRRRDFLAGGLALTAAPLGCKHGPRRKEVLEALVAELAIPDMRAVLFHSERLEEALTSLASQPSPAAVDAARARWRDTILAWKRAYCFRNGPLVTTSAFLRSLFWPARTSKVDLIVHGQQPIDDALVRELGVDEKGIFALEHLLFSSPAPVEGVALEGERARALTRTLARAVTASAEAAVRILGDGRAFTTAFVAREQESTSLLVNQLVDTVETVANSRLARLLALGGRPPRATEVEGLSSAMVFPIPHTLVEGSQRLYLGVGGGGLGDLVKAVAPAIDGKARSAFATAASAFSVLTGPPLAQVLGQRTDLEKAAQATKALELSLKVDVAGALGVTLAFTGGDGD